MHCFIFCFKQGLDFLLSKMLNFSWNFEKTSPWKIDPYERLCRGSNLVTVFSLFLGECVSVSDSSEGLENFFHHALRYNLNALFHFLLQTEGWFLALKNAQFLMKIRLTSPWKIDRYECSCGGSNLVTVFSLFLGECVSVSDSLERLENFFPMRSDTF